MAYFLGALAADAITHVVTNEMSRSRAQAAVARWNSPLSRLGRCGIWSLRVRHAVDRTWDEISDASLDGWTIVNGMGRGLDVAQCTVVFGANSIVVIETVIGADYITAVRQADAQAWALAATVDGIGVEAMVCRADLDEEPRAVPGPSGTSLTVTGLPWLSGVLRRSLGYDPPNAVVPAPLREAVEAALHRADLLSRFAVEAVRILPANAWWIIRHLYLDDGLVEPLSLVFAGPTGAFVIEVGPVDDPACVARVSRHTQRLRGYLPGFDVLPLIVTETIGDVRYGPADTGGYPIAWLPPDSVINFISQTRARGLPPPCLAMLNGPAPGWYRRVVPSDGGHVTEYGWAE